MNTDLQRLKELVEKDGFTKDDREYVQSLEDQLKNIVAIEKLSQHPVIAPYIEYLTKERLDCKELLSTDQTLNDVMRSRLFERIRQIEHFQGIWTTDRELVEQQIKGTLEEANAR